MARAPGAGAAPRTTYLLSGTDGRAAGSRARKAFGNRPAASPPRATAAPRSQADAVDAAREDVRYDADLVATREALAAPRAYAAALGDQLRRDVAYLEARGAVGYALCVHVDRPRDAAPPPPPGRPPPPPGKPPPAVPASAVAKIAARLATEPGAFEAVPGEARRALAFALVDCAARDAADAGAYAARFRDAVAARVGRPTDAPPPPCLREGWCVVLARVSRGRSFPVGSRSRRRTSRTAGGGAPWRPRRRTGGGRPAFGNRVGAL